MSKTKSLRFTIFPIAHMLQRENCLEAPTQHSKSVCKFRTAPKPVEVDVELLEVDVSVVKVTVVDGKLRAESCCMQRSNGCWLRLQLKSKIRLAETCQGVKARAFSKTVPQIKTPQPATSFKPEPLPDTLPNKGYLTVIVAKIRTCVLPGTKTMSCIHASFSCVAVQLILIHHNCKATLSP